MVSGHSVSNELVRPNDGDRSAWKTVHKRRQQPIADATSSADSSTQTESDDPSRNQPPRSSPIAIQPAKHHRSVIHCPGPSPRPVRLSSGDDLPSHQHVLSATQFIMSPTDPIDFREQKKAQHVSTPTQPEPIDFKRCRSRAIRVLYQNQLHLPQREARLRVNFVESLLHGKIHPCGLLDGFTLKLSASGLFVPKQVILPVTTFWFNLSERQTATPYLGFINLQGLPKRGYHAPAKGTMTLALLNPNGTAVHVFLIQYDLSDMPANHRTFLRQRVILLPEANGNEQSLRYLAHLHFVTSQTGKLYLHSDVRLIFAHHRLDFDDRIHGEKPLLVTRTDMPSPKYWSRK